MSAGSTPLLAPLTHATRQQIFNALFNNFVLKIPPPTGMTWKLQSQRLRQWDDVNAADQPACFLYRGVQTTKQAAYGVLKWQWRASIWIYYRVDGLKSTTTYPDQVTDQLIDDIEQTFQSDPMTGVIDLGGLVKNVWIDGTIVFDSGIVDNQAILVVPLCILV